MPGADLLYLTVTKTLLSINVFTDKENRGTGILKTSIKLKQKNQSAQRHLSEILTYGILSIEKQNINFKNYIYLETPNKITFICVIKPYTRSFNAS